MAKVIWRAGKIAIMVLLPLMVLGVILFLVKSGTFAQVEVVPTAEEPAAVVTEDTAVAQWVAEQVELAKVYQNEGHNDQSFEVYNDIIQQYPGTSFDLQVRVLQVKLCISEKNIPAAETITQEIINDFSGHADLCPKLYDISYDYWNNDQCAKGKVLYDYIIQNFPGNSMAFEIQALMARCEIRLGNTAAADQAVNVLKNEYSGHNDLYAELYALVNEYFWKLEHAKYESLCEYISQNSCDSSIAAKALIRLELNMENLAAAEQAMIDFKADFPEDQTLYPELNEIADRFNQQKNLDIAKACFQYVYQDSSDSNLAINARKWAATIEIQLGNDSAAESLIRALKNDHSGHPQLFTKLNELAGDFLKAGSPDKAKALYDYVYQNSPDKEIAYSSLAESLSCEVRLGNRDAITQAIELLNAEDGAAEDYVDRVQAICRLHIQSGDLVAAITCINRALNASPDHPKAVSLLKLKATCYINMGMKGQADAVQEEIALLATEQEYADFQNKVACKYRMTGDYKNSIKLFQQVLDSNLDRSGKLTAYAGLAMSYVRLDEWQKVADAVEIICRDFADHKRIGWAIYVIAEQCYGKHNYDLAKELTLYVIEHSNDVHPVGESAYMAAHCAKKSGDTATQMQCYLLIMEKYPKSEFAHRVPNELGSLYRKQKDYEQAEYWYTQQRELYKDDLFGARATFNLGVLYANKLEDYAKAAEVLENYMQWYPTGPRMKFVPMQLAICYDKLGDKTRAISVLIDSANKYQNQSYYLKRYNELMNKIQEGIH